MDSSRGCASLVVDEVKSPADCGVFMTTRALCVLEGFVGLKNLSCSSLARDIACISPSRVFFASFVFVPFFLRVACSVW